MKNIHRLSLALVALGLSAPAFADSNVLVPSQHGGFKVGIDALYLRTNGSGLDYATTTTLTNPPTDFALGLNRNAVVDPSYDWGFYAQVGYLFPCTGNDLTIGYTYLNSSYTDSVIAPPVIINGDSAITTAAIVVLPLSDLTFNALSSQGYFGAAEGKFELTLNAVDLEAGQRFTTGSYDMRMFAGLRYANINAALKTFAHPFEAPNDFEGLNTTTSGEQAFNSQFRGLGPRIGVDARYCLSSGFGLDADLSTSLLAGTVDTHYNAIVSTRNDVLPSERFASKNGSNTRVVPVLEAKLGADYTYIMDCRCKSALVFEAGYQVTNYFNASDVQSKVTRVDSFNNANLLSSNSTNDVAFDGPYLGVKYYA